MAKEIACWVFGHRWVEKVVVTGMSLTASPLFVIAVGGLTLAQLMQWICRANQGNELNEN